MPPETSAPASLPDTTSVPTMLYAQYLRPNPRNRRTRVDGDFVASVRENGVIERLVVRPIDEDDAGHTHEIVCGHRRWMAAKQAEIHLVPVDVRELDDAAAAELAIIENLHRESLTPLEEADAFRWLVEDQGRSVADVAARVHRSEAYVRQRLHLHGLIEPLRVALDADRIAMDGALLVAQTPEKVQREVAEEIERVPTRDRITRSDVANWLTEHWRQLLEAPFDVSDATLVETAGSCGTCPKRTGTQGVLFDAVEVADACLDEECWSAKSNAGWARTAADASKRGLRVLTDKEAREIIPYGRAEMGSGWVGLDAEACYPEDDSPAPKWRDILGPDVPRAVGRDRHGKVHELAEARGAATAAKKFAKESGNKELAASVRENERYENAKKGAGAKGAKGAKADAAAAAAAARKEAEEKEAKLVSIVACAMDVETRTNGVPFTLLLRRLVSTLAHGVWMDVAQRFVKRRHIDDADGRGGKLTAAEAVERWASTTFLGTGVLLGALTELVILAHDRMSYGGGGDVRADFAADLDMARSKVTRRKASKVDLPDDKLAKAAIVGKGKASKLTNAAAKSAKSKPKSVKR